MKRAPGPGPDRDEPPARLIYLFTDLPDQPGTFAFAEVEAMADRGFEIEIFCLRTRLADGPGARHLRDRFCVASAPYLSASVLLASVRMFLRRPLRVMHVLLASVLDTWRSPRILLKTLAILPKCCWFAERVERGVRLHAFWASLPARAAWSISRLCGAPYSTWAHAGADIYNRRHQTEPALRRHLNGATLVLTCNRANLEYFARILSHGAHARVVHHPHGVDLERFRPSEGGGSRTGRDGGRTVREGSRTERDDATIHLLSVGRLSLAKGFQHAIDACAILREQGVAFEYRIVGDGPLRETLTSSIRQHGLEGRVRLLGSLDQSELPELYQWADLLLAPSIIGPAGARDGLPNVLLEAMACNVPCVGSDAVGIPEAVRPGETGFLAPPGDPAGIAQAVRCLAENEPLRLRMGEHAGTWVRANFSRPACMDRLAQILRTLGRSERSDLT
jgi:glycosyltransferase involved in cell wall biosynthesis